MASLTLRVSILHGVTKSHAREKSGLSFPVFCVSQCAVWWSCIAIKSMIAAAKADGHIDASEQQRIFNAVEEMELSTEVKGMIFDLLQQPITVEELAAGMDSVEQKTEIYLVACLVIDPDHPSEQAHLDQLEAALKLPEGLAQQLQWQAQRAMAGAA